jgi:hypothetical protein
MPQSTQFIKFRLLFVLFGSALLSSPGAKAQEAITITDPATEHNMDALAEGADLIADRARLAETLLRVQINAVRAQIKIQCEDHLPYASLEQIERQLSCKLDDIKANPAGASDLVRDNEPDIRRALDEIDRIYHQGAAMSADPDACASHVLARYQYLFKQQQPQQ